MHKQGAAKRTALTFVIAVIITLLCSVIAFGVGSISLEKTAYLAEEKMGIKLSGMTPEEREAVTAWVGIFKANATSNHYLTYKYVNDPEFDGGTWSPPAPSDLGDYEVRLYVQVDGKDNLVSSVPFKVESRKANPGDVTLSKNFFKVKEKASAIIGGLGKSQIDDGAWAGIYRAGDENDKYLIYQYVSDMERDPNTKNPVYNFTAPSEFGNYEVRVFTKNVSGDLELMQKVLFDTKPFTVGSVPANPGDVTLSKSEFLVGDMATVTFKEGALTNEQIDDGAWFGIYNASDALNTQQIGSYVYVSDVRSKKFTIDIEVPDKLGSYELRVFSKNIPLDKLEQLKIAKFAVVPFKVVSRKSNDKSDLKTKNSVMTDSQLFKMKEAVVVVIKCYKSQAESEAAYKAGKSGGLSPGQIAKGAWAGLFKLGDNNSANPLTYVYLNDSSTVRRTTADGSKIWDFQAPEAPGDYVIKVFTQTTDADKRDAVFFAEIPITIANATKVTQSGGAFNWANYTLKVVPNPISVKVGGTVTLNVIAQPKKGVSATPAEVNNLVIFTVKDTNKAKVSLNAVGKGVIKGIKPGTTTLVITVKGTRSLVYNVTINVKLK